MSLTASVCLLLSEWISFLLVAVPTRSRRTFVERLIGCLLNPEGWVTRALGAICREAHGTTYYKLIERAHVSAAELSVRLLPLVQSVFPSDVANLIIDDTLVPRTAKTGPGISVKHDHARKANRPTFLNSQCWVTLAWGAGEAGVGTDGADTLLAGGGVGPARQALGSAAVDRLDQGPCLGGALADRCLVHAQEPDSALARTTGADYRTGATGYGFMPTARTGAQASGTETQVRSANRCRDARRAASAGEGAVAVRQGAMCPDPLADCGRPLSAGCSGAGGMVRDAATRRHLVAPTPDSGDRDGSDRAGRGGDLCHALGDRAFVPQSEALVGRDESVAAVEGGAGTVDADPLHGVCLDANAGLEAVALLSFDGDCALAQGGSDHGRSFWPVDANSIYRTSRKKRIRPEVGAFRDAVPGSGSAFAVLTPVASRQSA